MKIEKFEKKIEELEQELKRARKKILDLANGSLQQSHIIAKLRFQNVGLNVKDD